jgi:hypothetical protein
MNVLLSLLGSLPSSSSAGGHLNNVDYLKMARMAIMLVAGYCITAILTTLMHDISGGAFSLPEALSTPLMGFLTLALEMVRRKLATPVQIPPTA